MEKYYLEYFSRMSKVFHFQIRRWSSFRGAEPNKHAYAKHTHSLVGHAHTHTRVYAHKPTSSPSLPHVAISEGYSAFKSFDIALLVHVSRACIATFQSANREKQELGIRNILLECKVTKLVWGFIYGTEPWHKSRILSIHKEKSWRCALFLA